MRRTVLLPVELYTGVTEPLAEPRSEVGCVFGEAVRVHLVGGHPSKVSRDNGTADGLYVEKCALLLDVAGILVHAVVEAPAVRGVVVLEDAVTADGVALAHELGQAEADEGAVVDPCVGGACLRRQGATNAAAESTGLPVEN